MTKETTQINPDEIEFKTNNFKKEPEYWEMAKERFQEMQDKKKPKKFQLENGGSLLVVEVEAETDEMGKTNLNILGLLQFHFNFSF